MLLLTTIYPRQTEMVYIKLNADELKNFSLDHYSGFALRKMKRNFAEKLLQNYFATKTYLIFTLWCEIFSYCHIQFFHLGAFIENKFD